MASRSATVRRTAVRGPFGEPRTAAVIRLDDGNAVGWGEASPLESYSPDTLDEAERDLRAWARVWDGGVDDPGSSDLAPSARCAIDTALLDLDSRARSEALHVRLAGILVPIRAVESVPVCALVTLPGVDRPGVRPAAADVVTEVAHRVAEGFLAVKFKVGSGASFRDQLDLLSLVRASYPDLQIRLDANGAWSVDEARHHLAELSESVRPDLVEQPVGMSDLLTFRAAPVALAADESLRLPGSLAVLTAPDACRAIVLKPMMLGGLRACASLAAEAHSRGIRAIVSHTFGGPISHASACELALAVAAAEPTGSVTAVGLEGHDGVAQMAGSRIVTADVWGHGAEGES